MDKQDFILTELEAIAKDIILIVDEERRSLEVEKARRRERVEGKQGTAIGQPVRMQDPDRILPELRYVEARLDAVKRYLSPP